MNAVRDQFLFEDKAEKEKTDNALAQHLNAEKGKAPALGSLMTVFAYKGLDLVWDSWERTPGGQHFGTSLNAYVPHPPVWVPIVLLAGGIAVLALTAHRARGVALASLWVHDSVFTLVPTKKKVTSFDLDAARVAAVTVQEKSGRGKSGLLLEDATGRRHTIDELANAAELGPFADYCRHRGVRFLHEPASITRDVVVGTAAVGLLALFVCALNTTHPVQLFTKLFLSGLVGFLVPRMLGEKKE